MAVTQEARDAINTLVGRAMEGPTNAIIERLDRLEARVARSADQEATPNTQPPNTGMSSSAGGGSMSNPAAAQFPTPSGRGAIPPGLQVSGLSSYNSPGGGGGGGVQGQGWHQAWEEGGRLAR